MYKQVEFFFFIVFLGVFTPAVAQQPVNSQQRGLEVTLQSSNAVSNGSTHALIVGISQYKNLISLKYADKDAYLFRDYLVATGISPANIKLLVDQKLRAGP